MGDVRRGSAFCLHRSLLGSFAVEAGGHSLCFRTSSCDLNLSSMSKCLFWLESGLNIANKYSVFTYDLHHFSD